MEIDRAREILDPTHREHYASIDIVNDACEMGMAALTVVKDLLYAYDSEKKEFVLTDEGAEEARIRWSGPEDWEM